MNRVVSAVERSLFNSAILDWLSSSRRTDCFLYPWYQMKPAGHSGMFIPSDMAMNSDSVDDLEFSFCILGHIMKNPIPSVAHMPVVDLIFCRLANAASIDVVTLGGMVHPSRNGSSLVVFRNDFTLSSFRSSSTVGAFTHPHSSPIAGPISGHVRFARYSAVATCVWKILASATLSSVASGVQLKRYGTAG
jgi:hypothetical protein